MRTISALEAQADFDRLLDEVERGESVLISHNGRIVARIVPAPQESELQEITAKGIPQGQTPEASI
jgi:prevent-host-death family protein